MPEGAYVAFEFTSLYGDQFTIVATVSSVNNKLTRDEENSDAIPSKVTNMGDIESVTAKVYNGTDVEPTDTVVDTGATTEQMVNIVVDTSLKSDIQVCYEDGSPVDPAASPTPTGSAIAGTDEVYTVKAGTSVVVKYADSSTETDSVKYVITATTTVDGAVYPTPSPVPTAGSAVALDTFACSETGEENTYVYATLEIDESLTSDDVIKLDKTAATATTGVKVTLGTGVSAYADSDQISSSISSGNFVVPGTTLFLKKTGTVDATFPITIDDEDAGTATVTSDAGAADTEASYQIPTSTAVGSTVTVDSVASAMTINKAASAETVHIYGGTSKPVGTQLMDASATSLAIDVETQIVFQNATSTDSTLKGKWVLYKGSADGDAVDAKYLTTVYANTDGEDGGPAYNGGKLYSQPYTVEAVSGDNIYVKFVEDDYVNVTITGTVTNGAAGTNGSIDVKTTTGDASTATAKYYLVDGTVEIPVKVTGDYEPFVSTSTGIDSATVEAVTGADYNWKIVVTLENTGHGQETGTLTIDDANAGYGETYARATAFDPADSDYDTILGTITLTGTGAGNIIDNSDVYKAESGGTLWASNEKLVELGYLTKDSAGEYAETGTWANATIDLTKFLTSEQLADSDSAIKVTVKNPNLRYFSNGDNITYDSETGVCTHTFDIRTGAVFATDFAELTLMLSEGSTIVITIEIDDDGNGTMASADSTIKVTVKSDITITSE